MHPKIHMGSQGTSSSQNNLGKEQNWRIDIFRFQDIYGYGNQDTVLLVVKIDRSMDQNRKLEKDSHVLEME